MAKAYVTPILSAALEKFKQIVLSHAEQNGGEGKRLVVFCEDRLSLAAERAVCEAVGGTFAVSVYTLSRFLSSEAGKCEGLLSGQGSAMAIRRLIEKNRDKLQLFKRLSTANAAQEVYDTIALLYSSRISAEELGEIRTENKFLQRKIHDLALLYTEYSAYLSETGAVDRNVYLRRLPDVIRSSEKMVGADAVFLGFQAFTSSVKECVRACMETADEVYGLFIGGKEKKYVNEGWADFIGVAQSVYGAKGCECERVGAQLNPAAEILRTRLLEPESFHEKCGVASPEGQIEIAEASDEQEECAYIAASIEKCVHGGDIRYREISVMLPDPDGYQPIIERVFGEHNIPYYFDRRYPLSSHAVCAFICDYLTCAADGCRPESVRAVVASPLFTRATRRDKDVFVNYTLRAVTSRGAIKKPVIKKICEEPGLDYEGAERVRTAFWEGLALLPARDTDGAEICRAVRETLTLFGVKEKLEELSSQAEEQGFLSSSAMSARAYEAVLSVLAEAEKLAAGEKTSIKDFIKMLKSGFAAAEISLIPPKQDAVFISDVSACANTGSKVLFACGLTDAVPAASQDTAILTDGELTSLEKLSVSVSPKIAQVNKRVREVTALNICAFSKKLYLSYPAVRGGEECGVSEIISYARHLFGLKPVSVRDIAASNENFAYFYGHVAPAVRAVGAYLGGDDSYGEKRISALCAALGESGVGKAISTRENKGGFDCSALYKGYVSPTALETYFACPYKAFMQRGLKLAERREGRFRPLDSGNFIHAVLERTASEMNGFEDDSQCARRAEEIGRELLALPEFSATEGDKGAEYGAEELVKEGVRLSLGMYEQLKNSGFRVENVEQRCKLPLGGGLTLGGRIDRVDACGDMVRVVDYKTGTIDDSPSSYYMGLKLQLPLYLSAAAEGRRAIGAYYFPANTDYSADGVGAFTLKGFMDGSEEVVRASDSNLEEKQKSAYVGAYLNGRKTDRAMTRDDFTHFLNYSGQIAADGAARLSGGDIQPSPVEGACGYCKFAGCCGYDCEQKGTREEVKADCATIAQIAKERGEEEK